MQVVPDLVDRPFFGLDQLARLLVERVVLEEEAHLVPRGQKVVVPHVLFRGRVAVFILAGGEPRHGVVRQWELGEELLCLGEETLARLWREV